MGDLVASVIMMDPSDRIVLVNAAQAERLFLYGRGELEAFFRDPTTRSMGGGRDPDRRFVLSSVVDIAERRRHERERDELLGQLDALNVLLKEVHHRVKNNLQVISSLINMQMRSLGTDVERDALVECRARVRAIALIHEKLYQSKDQARVPFSEYARGLAEDVFHATRVSPEKISLELAVEDVALAVDKAIPCGLILNELITNALKHAFPEGRSGTVRVELVPFGAGGLRLVVQDDGVGLPAGLDVHHPSSLGLQLVQMLAKQLDATLEVEAAEGTHVRLAVPGPA